MKHRPTVRLVHRLVDADTVTQYKARMAHLARASKLSRHRFLELAKDYTELEVKYSDSQANLRNSTTEFRKYIAQVHLETKLRDAKEHRKDILNVAFGIALGVTVQEIIRLLV